MKKIFLSFIVTFGMLVSCKKDKDVVANPPEVIVVKADFSVEKITSFAPLKIKFTNNSLQADSYEWSINNIKISTAQSPEFMLSRKGTYSVKLVALKGSKKDSITRQVTVENDPTMKAAYFFSGNWTDSSDFNNDISSGNGLLVYEKDRKNIERAGINLGSLGGALFLPGNLLQSTGTATTISIWFKAVTLIKNPVLGCWQTGAETTVAVPCIYFDDAGKLRMKFPTGTANSQILKDGLTANTWQHLVLTGNGTLQKAYVNGTLAGEINDAAINYGTMNFGALGYAYVPGGNLWPGISGSTHGRL